MNLQERTPRNTIQIFLCLSELILSCSYRVWQHSHCDYLQPLFKIQDLAVSILSAKMFCAWAEALSQYSELKGCEIEIELGGGLYSLSSSPMPSLWPSFLREDRSLHIVRCLHPPQLHLSEISSIPLQLRNPACLHSLTVHWRHGPDGTLSMAGCSLKLSSSITLWWAVGSTIDPKGKFTWLSLIAWSHQIVSE